MEIHFHANVGSVGRTPPSKPVSRDPQTEVDAVAMEKVRALRHALEQTPASRREMVERGIELVGQVNYPPHETIQQISHLLALHLYPDGSESS
jgi:hypothetical protein